MGVQMIVLFTDFGVAGPYSGQVNAVLHQIAPDVPVIQLFADAPAGQPKPAAYLLAAYARWFPAGTVLLCVVDPGVGSARCGLIVEADGRADVGAGNPGRALAPPRLARRFGADRLYRSLRQRADRAARRLPAADRAPRRRRATHRASADLLGGAERGGVLV